MSSFKNSFELLSKWSFFLLVMTLPLGLFFNGVFSIIFFLFFTLYMISTGKTNKKNPVKLFVLNVPVLLPLLSLAFSTNLEESVRIFIKTTPILFFSIFAIYMNSWFKNKIEIAFKFLVLGCLLSAIFCWLGVAFDLLNEGVSLKLFFTKEYSHHRLSEIVGVHTPYLALFINAALIFLFYGLGQGRNEFSGLKQYFSFFILVLFLVHLMARNAIFCLIIYSSFYLLWKKKWLVFVSLSTTLTAFFVIITFTENNFLRDRFLNSLNVFEKQKVLKKQDKRFGRWSSSLEVFKKAPVFGVGTGSVDYYRKIEYLKKLDSEAYNFNYNSHNQYIEYLCTYGLFGGGCILFLFGYIVKTIYQKRSIFLAMLFLSFLMSMLTESILVRTWGISFFGILYIILYSWEERDN